MNGREYTAAGIYWRLLVAAKPFWKAIVALFVLNVVAMPLRLLAPLPLTIVVDYVLGQKAISNTPLVWLPAGLSGGDALLGMAIGLLLHVTLLAHLNALAIRVLHGSTAEYLVVRFRSTLFQHLQSLSLRYHDDQGSTESTYRIQYDAPCIQWIVLDGIIPFLTALITIVAMLLTILAIDWSLAALAMLLAPVLFVVTHYWGKSLRERWRTVKDLQSNAMSLVQQSFSSIRVVKAFGSEERERNRFVDRARTGLDEQIKVVRSQGWFELTAGMLIAVGTSAALYLGASHVQAGTLSLGAFLLVWAYLGQLYGPLQTVSTKITTLQGSLASAERVLSLLDEVPEVNEPPHARPLDRCEGAWEIRDVRFAYNSASPVLEGINLSVPAGTNVGIEGPSGVGKSTLMHLLLRFYDPQEGQLLLDGVDIREYRIADLRNQFSVVLQEPILFHTS
ncbi:MAG: ABC transporter ATP-binding protein, partial [Planctomycetales bacterium]|nr:ABC transporter ATP-binding protein [Planctomycetales bacterium]